MNEYIYQKEEKMRGKLLENSLSNTQNQSYKNGNK
jgi:hypothetical protein